MLNFTNLDVTEDTRRMAAHRVKQQKELLFNVSVGLIAAGAILMLGGGMWMAAGIAGAIETVR